MAHNKGTAFTNFGKALNLLPPISDPSYPLRILVCRQVDVVPLPGAPTLEVTFSPEPDAETMLLMETWEDIP
jgi:hypothetical protein